MADASQELSGGAASQDYVWGFALARLRHMVACDVRLARPASSTTISDGATVGRGTTDSEEAKALKLSGFVSIAEVGVIEIAPIRCGQLQTFFEDALFLDRVLAKAKAAFR